MTHTAIPLVLRSFAAPPFLPNPVNKCQCPHAGCLSWVTSLLGRQWVRPGNKCVICAGCIQRCEDTLKIPTRHALAMPPSRDHSPYLPMITQRPNQVATQGHVTLCI